MTEFGLFVIGDLGKDIEATAWTSKAQIAFP